MVIKMLQVGVMETNCYIVFDRENGKGCCAIVDPGDDVNKILRKLDEDKLVPVAVLLTHSHFDHIGALPGLKDKYQDISIFAGKAENALLRDPALNISEWVRNPMSIEADRLLENMESFEAAGINFKCISTPGHTAGSTCFYYEEGGILFCGDTLFEGGAGRTDLPTGNQAALFKSLAALMTLPGQTRCLPGHGNETTIDKERKSNPYISR